MKSEIELPPQCPVRTTLEMLGGKWRLVIIAQLANGTLRFNEIKKRIPEISEKMLTQELKTLIDNGLVGRVNYREVPPRVDYHLTKQGKLALPLIDEVVKFGTTYLKKIKRDAARA